MPSQLSPQGGVSGSPQSLVLQISGPIFHLIHNNNNESHCRFGKHRFLSVCCHPALTSNGVYSKRFHSVSTENTVADTSLRAIGVLGLSLCYYCTCKVKNTVETFFCILLFSLYVYRFPISLKPLAAFSCRLTSRAVREKRIPL